MPSLSHDNGLQSLPEYATHLWYVVVYEVRSQGLDESHQGCCGPRGFLVDCLLDLCLRGTIQWIQVRRPGRPGTFSNPLPYPSLNDTMFSKRNFYILCAASVAWHPHLTEIYSGHLNTPGWSQGWRDPSGSLVQTSRLTFSPFSINISGHVLLLDPNTFKPITKARFFVWYAKLDAVWDVINSQFRSASVDVDVGHSVDEEEPFTG